jgi:hypothetical protein
MYEEYLEDYVYKLMAKIASKFCRLFKSKQKEKTDESETSLVLKSTSTEVIATDEKENEKGDTSETNEKDAKIKDDDDVKETNDDKAVVVAETAIEKDKSEKSELNVVQKRGKRSRRKMSCDVDEDLSTLNYHVVMFLLWVCVALLNVPPLLTWAKTYK